MDNLERFKVHITVDRFDEQTPVTGSGVDGLTVSQVEPIGSCELSPGDPSPVGRCPQTGDLVYLDRPEDRINLHAKEMFQILVDMLTPGVTSASVIEDGRKLLAKLGSDVMASSDVEKLLRNHVQSFQTDFLTRLAADTTDDTDPRGVPLIIQKARALTEPVLDHEAAAASAGWKIAPDDTDGGTCGYEGHGRFARDIATPQEAARLCCELNAIEAPEIPMEHWSVSETLAAILSSRGEKVDATFPGGPIWARPARRGKLRNDPVLNSIAKEIR